jgi:hypothetical protein
MADKIFGDLVGTLRTFFRLATVGLKDVGGVLHIRDNADSADATIHVGGIELPTGASDGYVLTSNAVGEGSWAATGGALTVQESDGTPSVASVSTINVANGTLTDDGGGEVTIGAAPLSIDDLSDVDTTTTPPTEGQALLWDDGSSIFIPGDVEAVGGGTTTVTSETTEIETRELIRRVDLTSAGDVTFSSIPQTYDHLEVRFHIQSTRVHTTDYLMWNVNGDSTNTNYYNTYHIAGYSHAVYHTADSFKIVSINGASGDEPSTFSANILNYTSTSNDKIIQVPTFVRKVSSLAMYVQEGAGYWEPSTPAAITSLYFFNEVGTTFIAGSWIELWGIKKTDVVTDVSNISGVFDVETATVLIEEEVFTDTIEGSAGVFAATTGLDLSMYTALRLELKTNTVTADNLLLELNGDTTAANYHNTFHYATTAHAYAATSAWPGLLCGVGYPVAYSAPARSVFNMWGHESGTHVMAYADIPHDLNGVQTGVYQGASQWLSTAAVTSVKLKSVSGYNFDIGSSYTLIGIREQEVVTGVNAVNVVQETTELEVRDVIAEETLVSSGSFTSLSGLDLSEYDYLELTYTLPVSSNQEALLSFNSDTTTTNYKSAEQYGGTTHGATTDTALAGMKIAYIPSGGIVTGQGTLSVATGEYRCYTGSYARYDSGSTLYTMQTSSHWLNSADAITSLSLSGTFDTGAWYRLTGSKKLDVVTGVEATTISATTEEIETRHVIGEETLTSDGEFATLTDLDLSGYAYLEFEFIGDVKTATAELLIQVNSLTSGYYSRYHYYNYSGHTQTTVSNNGLYIGTLSVGPNTVRPIHRAHISGLSSGQKTTVVGDAGGIVSDIGGVSYTSILLAALAADVTTMKVTHSGANTFASGSWYRITGVKLTEVMTGISGTALTVDALQVSTADVSNPPTDAELDSVFGTPATTGAGFTRLLDDNNSDTNLYLVTSSGTSWWYTALTKAT